ncbi:MAG: signal peptide peptidase SppA [Nitrospirae bacterium]|nr:signal peptide peptidase SppA [Nitrospirota bacterium]
MLNRYMKWSISILFFFLGGCAFVNMSLVPPPSPLQEYIIEGEGRPKILLLDVSGFISENERGGALSLVKEPSLVAHVKEALQKAEKDKNIWGVIVKINSPGGTVTASDIIYHELMNFKKKTRVPVHACIMGTGTSGGYYIAAAADEISSHPSAITGSIGVIAMKFNIEGLLTKIGVEDETVKSGDKKDLFSPFRANTPEEKKILQSIIDSLQSRFIDAVFENRKDLLSRKEIEVLSDGRIYTADQALDSKLIDHIGYLDDAIERMKKSLGIEHAQIITYYRSGEYPVTIYSAYPANSPSLMGLLNNHSDSSTPFSGVEFLYLWKP